MSKKRQKKIQEYNRLYNLLHYYVNFILKHSYSSIIYKGKENIPNDGAIIFAPNHTNALMDALVALNIDLKPKVFVARADIFRNRRLAKILTFLKMMPIMRQRDGFNAVKKNQEIIDKSVDVLKDKIPFCIFPEGTHQAKFSSLPLSKGIFRIAFQAHEQMPQMPLYIVPVGLRYGNHFRFRSTVLIKIGTPINVEEFIKENNTLTQQEQINKMREELTHKLHSTIFHIPNDEEYDATYEICNAAEAQEIEKLRKETSCKNQHRLEIQFQANNNTLQRIETLKKQNPEKANKLIELANKAATIRKAKGIDTESASVAKPLASRLPRAAFTLLTLPYTIAATALAIPIILINKIIFTKLKDPAFKNSVRFIVNLFIWPILMVVYAIASFTLLPWQWALAATLLFLPSPIIAHELWKTARLIISDIKLLREKRLMKIYSQIREIISQG